jgi:hypothetical protein
VWDLHGPSLCQVYFFVQPELQIWFTIYETCALIRSIFNSKIVVLGFGGAAGLFTIGTPKLIKVEKETTFTHLNFLLWFIIVFKNWCFKKASE